MEKQQKTQQRKTLQRQQNRTPLQKVRRLAWISHLVRHDRKVDSLTKEHNFDAAKSR